MRTRKSSADYNRDFSLCCGGCEIVRDYEVGEKMKLYTQDMQELCKGCPHYQQNKCGKCQETIKSFGWISRKINGEWYDFCCYACYKKFEAKMKGVKA